MTFFRSKNYRLFSDLVVNFVTSQFFAEQKFDLLIDALLLQVSFFFRVMNSFDHGRWVDFKICLASDRLKNTVFSPIEVTKLTLDWSKWDLDVVDSLLLYIYTSRLNRSNLPGLHAASDFFAIDDLKKLIDDEINKPTNKHSKIADCLKAWINWR